MAGRTDLPQWIGKAKLPLACLATAIGLGFIFYRMSSLSQGVGFHADWALRDFAATVYYPTTSFFGGANPYDGPGMLAEYPVAFPFPFYLPALFLLYAPLTWLPYDIASLIYLGVSVALTVALATSSLRINGLHASPWLVLLVVGAVSLSRPGHWNLLVGQTVLPAVLGSYVALHFAQRSTAVSALGLVVSVIKPTFGVPVAVLMLVRGHLRSVAAGAVISLLINTPLLAILVSRAGGLEPFLAQANQTFELLRNDSYVNPLTSPATLHFSALIARWLQQTLPGWVELALFALVLATAAWPLLRRRAWDLLDLGIVCTATLLCTYHLAYDLLLLTAPAVALIGRKFPASLYRSWHYPVSVLLLTVLALNYCAGYAFISRFPTDSLAWLSLSSLNGLALLGLFAAWVHAAITQPHDG